jgi:uncharacterized membrane protein
MKNRRLALSTIYFIRYCMTGLMWTVYGVLNFFDDDNMYLKIISTICMALAVISTLASLFIRQDREDYASRLHLMKACTLTLFIILLVVMATSTLSAFVPKNMFDFNLLYPFIIGLTLMLIGVLFIYCEKWGDDTWLA